MAAHFNLISPDKHELIWQFQFRAYSSLSIFLYLERNPLTLYTTCQVYVPLIVSSAQKVSQYISPFSAEHLSIS